MQVEVEGFFDLLLKKAARNYPTHRAVWSGGQNTTYRELHHLVDVRVMELIRVGVSGGDRCVVRASLTIETIVNLCAVSRVRAVAVPVSATLGQEELEHVVHDCAGRFVISGTRVEVVNSAFKTIRTDCTVSAELILYTSGTTGRPKGIVCDAPMMRFASDAIGRELSYRKADIILLMLPLSFDYGLYQLLLAFAVGACVALYDVRAAPLAPRVLELIQPTIIPVVPALATILINAARRVKFNLPVRLITNTGQALPPDLQRLLLGVGDSVTLGLMYGLTECKRVSIGLYSGTSVPTAASGFPLHGTRVRITDSSGADMPMGVVGEIRVSGPHVSPGYWPLDESARLRPNELVTGDFGYVDELGQLFIRSRGDGLVKVRGTRVHREEILAAAHSVDGVELAALKWDALEEPVLYVQARGLNGPQIRRLMSSWLDPLKIPSSIYVLEELPASTNWKV